MSIGQNIKMVRKAKGMTQAELAEKSGISRSYLADLEGDRYTPSLNVLYELSHNLETEVPELIKGFGYEAGVKLWL